MACLGFRWLGAAGFEMVWEDFHLAVDPFFSRPPRRYLFGGRPPPQDALAERYLPACQAILISHAHYDHLMDAPSIALRTGAAVYGSANTCNLLAAMGVPQRQIHLVSSGDRLEIGPFSTTVYPARHVWLPLFGPGKVEAPIRLPLRLRDYRMDDCLNFFFQAGDIRLLSWLGTQADPAPPANVLLANPQNAPAFFQDLLQRVGPRLLIPIHWDDFTRSLQETVRPFYIPPRKGALLPRRLDLETWQREIQAAFPAVQVYIPDIMAWGDLAQLLHAGSNR